MKTFFRTYVRLISGIILLVLAYRCFPRSGDSESFLPAITLGAASLFLLRSEVKLLCFFLFRIAAIFGKKVHAQAKEVERERHCKFCGGQVGYQLWLVATSAKDPLPALAGKNLNICKAHHPNPALAATSEAGSKSDELHSYLNANNVTYNTVEKFYLY